MKVRVTVGGDNRTELVERAQRFLDKLSNKWRESFDDPRQAVDQHITATAIETSNGYSKVVSWSGELEIDI